MARPETPADLIYYEGSSSRSLGATMVSISPAGRLTVGSALCRDWPKDKPYVRLAKPARDPQVLVLVPATLQEPGSLRLRRDHGAGRIESARALAFLGLTPARQLRVRAIVTDDGRVFADLGKADRPPTATAEAKLDKDLARRVRSPRGSAGPSAGRRPHERITCLACGKDCAAVRDVGGRLRPFKHRDPDGIECAGVE